MKYYTHNIKGLSRFVILAGVLSVQLLQKINGRWERINQEVHGNDFWQTEYNTTNGTWDITYNINLDSEKDKRQQVKFKFSSQ